jgi:hypothetical protein
MYVAIDMHELFEGTFIEKMFVFWYGKCFSFLFYEIKWFGNANNLQGTDL